MVKRSALLAIGAALTLALPGCNAILGISGDVTTEGDGGIASSSQDGGSSGATGSSSGASSGGSSSGLASSSSSSGSSTSSGGTSSGSSSGSSSSSSGSSSSGSSSSSSSGGSSSSSSSSGGEDGGSVVPTTCQGADGEFGCCVGNTLYYCPSTVTSKVCSGGMVCGWSTQGIYDCVPSPGGVDPSGQYPINCK